MKAAILGLALGASAMCAPSAQCRCAERDLADYFSAAEEVTVGRLLSSTSTEIEGVAYLDLDIRLDVAAHKTFRSEVPSAGSVVRYRTTIGSASCGVEAKPDASYVLFALRSGSSGVPIVDTCSGTRVLLAPDGSPPGEFRDVPARFVPGQLNAMAGIEVLAAVSANAPDPSDQANEVLVGLLDVTGFSHAGFARLYESPDRGSPVVEAVEAYEALEGREVDYEQSAAVVYSEIDGWYRLRLSDGRFGWLPPDLAGTYFPYPEVAVNRLNYLTDFHGFVWPGQGAGIPFRIAVDPTDDETPVEIHEVAMLGGFPWLRVTVLGASPCEGAEREVAVAGWIPAYGTAGEPSAWFYSRGC